MCRTARDSLGRDTEDGTVLVYRLCILVQFHPFVDGVLPLSAAARLNESAFGSFYSLDIASVPNETTSTFIFLKSRHDYVSNGEKTFHMP
jgi:hypothetical protein